jgi:hypothetical protein
MNGYLNPLYAQSLAEFGTPRKLPLCGGWILERSIPGFPYRDAMGCYPLFLCQDWSQVHSDLKEVESELVSLSLVADPFGQYDSNLLHQYFDVAIPFKQHFIADVSRPLHLPRNHRYYAHKALKEVTVELCADPAQYLDEWTDLYAGLAKRYNIQGVSAFSKTAFAKQLLIPELVMFRAVYQGSPVGAYLWYLQNDVAYGHLGAVNELGQSLMASYAILWTATEYLATKVHWIDHGAGAGIKSDGKDGLSQFKRGWSTETRTAYFCGRIFNREKYEDIVKASAVGATDYFPAYRKGEFG